MTKLWRKLVALVARFTNWLSPSLWRWLQVQELRFLMWRRPDIIEQEIKSNAAEMARGSHRPDLQEHFEKMGRLGTEAATHLKKYKWILRSLPRPDTKQDFSTVRQPNKKPTLHALQQAVDADRQADRDRKHKQQD